MQKVYKDKPVTVIRTAHEGDKGYKSDDKTSKQSLIRLQDGGDIAVLNSELTETPELVPVLEPKQEPKEPETSPVDRLIHSTEH